MSKPEAVLRIGVRVPQDTRLAYCEMCSEPVICGGFDQIIKSGPLNKDSFNRLPIQCVECVRQRMKKGESINVASNDFITPLIRRRKVKVPAT